MKEIRFESLIRHLEKSDERILLGTLSLMNLIYARANDEERLRILRVVGRYAADNERTEH